MSRKLIYLIVAGIILILIPAIFILVYSFNHIDETNMRIFVNNWKWYIPIFSGWILIQYATFKNKR